MTQPPIRTAWLSRPGWSAFGRVGPNGNKHAGHDYYVPRGTPIYATGNGKVTGKAFSPDKRMGFGYNLTITYDDGRRTLDAHFDQASPLSIGSRVTENTIVGYVGNTGNAWNVFWSTGGKTLSHDHHQVWLRGVLTDPLKFYSAPTAPASGNQNPVPAEVADLISKGSTVIITRLATKEIAIFGADFARADGFGRGRHVFTSVSEYNAFKSVCDAAITKGQPAPKLPTVASSDIIGVDENGWGAVCNVYGV